MLKNKKDLNRIENFCRIIIISAAFGFFSCSPKIPNSDSADAPLNLTGSLNLAITSQSFIAEKLAVNPITSLGKITEENVSAMSVDFTLYTVTCATSTTPVQYGTATVAANGSFNINITGGKNQPLACYLVDALGVRQADFIISDSSKKDLNGAAQVSNSATYSKSADLGAVSFDPNAGEVTVPKSAISASVSDDAASTGVVFDPTGAWTIGAVDFALPSGVKGPCAGGGGGGGGGNNCNGPPDGQSIYLKLWKGSQIVGGADAFGLQVWESPSQFSACGSKIGLTPAIKTSIGVDFSANGSADAAFSFVSSVANFHDDVSGLTGTVNLTNNWKMDTAKAQWDINPNCGPRDMTIGGITYSNSWVCGPDSASNYQAQLGGGCVDSAGNPVQLQDWSTITCGAQVINSDGIRSTTCSGNAMINSVSKAVTCTNKWAVTNASYNVLPSPSASFTWADMNSSKVAQNTLCSAIPTGTQSGQIAQLQCYANYYERSGLERSGACLPKVEMDWSATSAANFVSVDQIRPSGLVFFEQFKPFTDGNGGTMVTRQEHYDGVQVNGNSWVNCRVIETGGLTIKKLSDSKLLATYQQSTVTTSLSKPACLAKFNGARESFMFYLTK